MSDEPSQRIVVELVSSADVKRLEGRDDEIRNELKRVEQKVDGLHRTMYELMEAISNLRFKR